MGAHPAIGFDTFPAQGPVGRRVRVCFHYDTRHVVIGIVVRDDGEPPFRTIIALPDGRYVLGTECVYAEVTS